MNHRTLSLLITFLLSMLSSQGALTPDEIRAGLKSHDRALHIHDNWIRDPFIIIGPDDYYYLTGTTPNPGDRRNFEDPYRRPLSVELMEGPKERTLVGTKIRVWKSKDLVEWEEIEPIFDLDQGYWAQAHPEEFAKGDEDNWRLWAPEVHYLRGQWLAVHTSPTPVHQGANLIVYTGEGFSGEMEFPMGELMQGKHVPSLFEDDDGTIYLLYRNTFVVPLKPGYKGFASEPVRIDPDGPGRPDPNDPNKTINRIGHEGATIRKIGGKYIHFGTAWSTDQGRKGTYNLYYCEAEKLTGPYGPRKFAGRFLGHGTPFQDKEGRWWCTAFYNANQPPITAEKAAMPSVADDAFTLNKQGTTLVPLDVRVLENGEIYIRAKDPDYANPGPEEAQKL